MIYKLKINGYLVGVIEILLSRPACAKNYVTLGTFDEVDVHQFRKQGRKK